MKKINSKTKAFSLISLACIAVGAAAGAAIFAPKIESAVEANAWSGKQTPKYSAHYYDAMDGLTGSALKSELTRFCSSTHFPKSPSYDWSRYERADEVENDSSSVWCIYTTRPIKKSNHCGNYAWDRWNREHVYPQGRYPRSDKDNHNIFACEGQINNYRSSYPFGNASKRGGERKSVHGHLTDCYLGSGYFEPPMSSKGDIARSLMYTTLTYGYDINQIIESTKTLLEWHTLDPVDNRDIYRNNTVESMQGNRNPFVDHPEWAYEIWGNGDIPDIDIPTPPVETETSTPVETETVIPPVETTTTPEESTTTPEESTTTPVETTTPEENTTPSESKPVTPETTPDVEIDENVVLEKIAFSKAKIQLTVGDEAKLSYTVTPKNADNKVAFTSSDRSICEVDSNGKIKAYKVGSATITATSIKYSNISTTCKVNVSSQPEIEGGFFKLEEAKKDYSGTYLIGSQNGDVFTTMSSTSTDKINVVNTDIKNGKITDDANAIVFEKTAPKQDTYYLKNGDGKYLLPDSSKNGNKWGDKAGATKFEIIFNDGAFTFKNDAGKYLTYNEDATRILCYTHEIDPLQLFEKRAAQPGISEIEPATYTLDSFFGDFMSLVTCDGGKTAPSKDNWKKAETLFNKLSADDKNTIKTLSSNDAKYGKLVERYDYIVGKYGFQDYQNFMGRTITIEANKVPAPAVALSTRDLLVIISAVTLVSISAIVTIYLVIKKRQKRA